MLLPEGPDGSNTLLIFERLQQLALLKACVDAPLLVQPCHQVTLLNLLDLVLVLLDLVLVLPDLLRVLLDHNLQRLLRAFK